MSHRPPNLALPVAVAVAALLTGCGGSNSDQKANEAYASGVCTAIGGWLTKVKSLESVPSLDGLTKASIETKLKDSQTANRRLVSQLRAAPAPRTPEGRAAKEELDRLVTETQAANGSAETVVSTLSANASATQLAASLVEILPEFQTLRTTAQSTLTSLRSAGGALASAFKSEPACGKLG